MPAFITNAVQVQRFADALYNVAVGTSTMTQVNNDITTSGGLDNALNAYYTNSFAGVSTTTVAANMCTNLGIVAGSNGLVAADVTTAQNYIVGSLNAAAANARGAAIKAILNNFSALANDAVFGKVATKFNSDIDKATVYAGSADIVAGTVPTPVVAPVVNTMFTLTTGVDNITGSDQADTFNAVIDFAGGSTISSSTSTLTATDKVVGGAGTDTLNLTLQNANGVALGSGTAAVPQVNKYLFGATPNAATDTVVVNYGTLTNTVVTGADKVAIAAAFAAAINNSAGQAIAVSDGVDTVTVTAPIAGTALPAITFGAATKANEIPAVTFTTANTSASAASINLGDVSGVEVLNLRDVSGSALTFAANQIVGLTTVNNDRSTSNVTVSNLATGADTGIKGDGVTTEGTFTASYLSTATKAGSFNVDGGVNSGAVTWTTPTVVTSATINSTNGAQAAAAGQVNTLGGLTLPTSVAILNINATTSLTTGTIANASLTSISATGAGTTVNVSTVPAAVTTIDGSGLSAGGVTATLTGTVTSFKGGSGVDTVTTGSTTAATAVIDGGAGTADILALAATNDVITAAKAAQYTNFEILRSAVVGNVDMNLFPTFTSVQANSASGGAGGFINMTATQAGAVTVRTANATANNTGSTFGLKDASGTSDVLRLTLNNSTTTTGSTLPESVNNMTITGFETLNVVASSGASAAHSAISFTAAGDLKALNVSGVAPLDVTTTNITAAVAIDASAMTFVPGAGTFAYTQTGNIIKGSTVVATAQSDSLTVTAAVTGSTGDWVTYNAGAGDDTISATAAAINNTSAANASVKIDGGAGTDTLTLTDTASLTLVDNNFQYVTGVETIGYAVANKAISITSGGFFDSNFKTAGATLTLGDATNAQVNTANLATFTGNATVSLTATAATTQAQTIATGSGTDTVTLLAAGTTSGAHTIATGAGNDTINVTIASATVTTGSVTINAGAGQDTIVITGNGTANADTASNVVLTVSEGQSTVAAPDSVTGFVLNTATKVASSLNFDGTGAVLANITTTASAISGVNYVVTSGVMSFTGTGASTLSVAQKASIVQAVNTTADAIVAFTDASDTYVFHNGATAANAGDSLVKLVGVTALGLEATVGNVGFVLVG